MLSSFCSSCRTGLSIRGVQNVLLIFSWFSIAFKFIQVFAIGNARDDMDPYFSNEYGEGGSVRSRI